MAKISQDFSEQEAMRIAKTPQGQAMLRQLEQMDRQKLQQVAQFAASGDLQNAQRALQAMLDQQEKRKGG